MLKMLRYNQQREAKPEGAKGPIRCPCVKVPWQIDGGVHNPGLHARPRKATQGKGGGSSSFFKKEPKNFCP
jgi:hypothetical protein